MDKFAALIAWLKQPPTLKGIVILAGMAGFAVDPAKVNEIVLAASGLYAALALFYDNTSRSPKIPTAEELNKLLSSEKIVALVRLRKAKIAAQKELGETK
jgi:hypothetical protein